MPVRYGRYSLLIPKLVVSNIDNVTTYIPAVKLLLDRDWNLDPCAVGFAPATLLPRKGSI